jgi:hypothetical protein
MKQIVVPSVRERRRGGVGDIIPVRITGAGEFKLEGEIMLYVE